MRIHLSMSKNTNPVPFMHQHMLTGAIHKWLGKNDSHGNLSFYSFSRLRRAKVMNNALDYADGANMFISCWNDDMIKKLISGIQNDPNLFCGIEVKGIDIQMKPDFDGRRFFHPASPILIKRKIEGKSRIYLFDDEESSQLLTESLRHKMQEAGLPDDPDLHIAFDLTYPRKGTKKVDYKKGGQIIKNKCSWCGVLIDGSAESKHFAWSCGLGSSTGIGLGAIE